MTTFGALVQHPVLVGWVTDPPPTDNAVKAGWTAFAIFLLLIAATAILLFSFTRQLRKVNAADKAGLYGSEAEKTEESDSPAQS